MNRIKGWVAISAFSLLILGLPAIASAQWGGYGNGGYGNGGYGNGGYGNNGYGYNIKSSVKNLKDRAKRFENEVDRYDNNNGRYNRGGYGGYGGYGNYSGNLERLANQFKDATDRLEDVYGNGRNMNNSADEARRVLDIASAIDREMYNARGNGSLQNQWNSMRGDLNTIANAYGYNGGYNNNRYPGNNRNNRRNGNWRNNFPFPLPF